MNSKEKTNMPKGDTKGQIALPIQQCREAGIQPGDEYESYVANDGQITIVKKTPGAARGILRNLKPDLLLSDEQSLQYSLPT